MSTLQHSPFAVRGINGMDVSLDFDRRPTPPRHLPKSTRVLVRRGLPIAVVADYVRCSAVSWGGFDDHGDAVSLSFADEIATTREEDETDIEWLARLSMVPLRHGAPTLKHWARTFHGIDL